MKAGVNHVDERVFQVEARAPLKSSRQTKVGGVHTLARSTLAEVTLDISGAAAGCSWTRFQLSTFPMIRDPEQRLNSLLR